MGTTSMYFEIVGQEATIPELVSLTLESTMKTSVTFKFLPSEASEIYYMVALKGTQVPEFEEVLQGGPNPVNTTLAQYGFMLFREEEDILQLEITGLQAEMPYVLMIFLRNRQTLISPVYTLEFVTQGKISLNCFYYSRAIKCR